LSDAPDSAMRAAAAAWVRHWELRRAAGLEEVIIIFS
jgi:hypothetical protein